MDWYGCGIYACRMESRPETEAFLAADLWRRVSSDIAKRGLNHAHALLRQNAISPFRGHTEAPQKARGDATHWIDAEMRRAMALFVSEATNGEALYVGEEEKVPVNLKRGDLLARTDELDGTTNSLTLFGGYAIVVFIERVRKDEESVVHVAGAIAAATGEVTSWSRDAGDSVVEIEWPKPLSWGESGDSTRFDEPNGTEGENTFTLTLRRDRDDQRAQGLRPGSQNRIAANAAHRDRRALVTSALGNLLDGDENYWMSNGAGNPLVAPLLAGELAAIYEPKSLELHDAAFLVPLYLAGGNIRYLEGGNLDVVAHFEELGSQRTIGPFVAGASGTAVERLIRAIGT